MYALPLKSSVYLVVAVIDIGTSESGIAFSFKDQYLENPLHIKVCLWKDDRGICITTPTCGLFTKHRQFKAFGSEAENQYREHVEENTNNDVYFFKRIIMDLFKEEVNGEFCLEDQTGKRMASMDVLTACITNLRDRLIDSVHKTGERLDNSYIRWVLPVPVSWNKKSMEFMRRAAVKAGIPNEHSMIVKESEAVFQYCCLQNDEINKSSVCHPSWQDRHFLLLSVNNFAVNITLHRAQLNNHILESYKTKVENFGSTPLEKCLVDIFGSDVMDSYIAKHALEYEELKQDFGMRFRRVMDSKVVCSIPVTLVSHFESKRGISFADHITACGGGGEFRRGRLRIEKDIVKHKLRKIYEHIISSIQRTFELFRLIDLSAIIIVGKVSEYPMLQDFIMEAFSDKQLIVPKNADSAALKGAVIYGHHVLSGKINPQSTDRKRFSHH